MPVLAIVLAMLPAVAAADKVIVYEGTIRNQTVQESAKARLKLRIDGEKAHGYLRIYPPLEGSGPVAGSVRGGLCELKIVIDEDAELILRGACRDEGFDGGYEVQFETAKAQRGSFLLKPVADKPAAAAPGPAPVKGVGGYENAPPAGDWGVYQHTGTLGYDFLYRLRFINEREYTAFDRTTGTYTYKPATREFTFLTGSLAAYYGFYLTQEKGGLGRPKIVLRLKGKPEPKDPQAVLREYLYAFHRPEGIQ